MGKPTGFLEHGRMELHERPIDVRVKDYEEITIAPSEEELRNEGGRCMDCGVPFCHSVGCPVYNFIPEWNDAVYRGNWKEAWERLELTNNLPEITGRVCPAPCESACTLSISDSPVSIKKIELAVSEKAFEEGWTVPRPPKTESGRRVAVIGSGPSGLAAAQQLRRAGHAVTVFEKSDRIGGLLRYGIPDFKLEKRILDRRIDQMGLEGIEFETGLVIGQDISAKYLRAKYDVILLTMGAGTPRDIPIPGRQSGDVRFAMEFLTLSNKYVSGDIPEGELISARDRHVLVIGGGDTGSDCVGTSIRQGAKSVTQIEIMPKPRTWSETTNPEWPNWPIILRTSGSHAEGCQRDWNITTKEFVVEQGRLTAAKCARVEWVKSDPATRPELKELANSEFDIEANLVLLAMGFLHVDHAKLLDDLDVELDARGNISTNGGYVTSSRNVFTAGDANTGASLVVRAISHGRQAAAEIDEYLNA